MKPGPALPGYLLNVQEIEMLIEILVNILVLSFHCPHFSLLRVWILAYLAACDTSQLASYLFGGILPDKFFVNILCPPL